jgi:hypothetical protein
MDSYDPKSVAQALFANLFCWPEVAAVLLDYWRTQFTPVSPSLNQLLLLDDDDDAGDDDDSDEEVDKYEQAVLHGLQLFAGGLLIDIHARLQENALPAKTDTGARGFTSLWLVFATADGERCLALDDVFLVYHTEIHWPTPELRAAAKILATCFGHLATRPRDFWLNGSDHGMVGHLVLTDFRYARELAVQFYRPSVFMVTHVFRYLDWWLRHALSSGENQDVDARLLNVVHRLAHRLVRAQEKQKEGGEPLWSFGWHPQVDAHEHEVMTLLYTILQNSILPADLWRRLNEFVPRHVRRVCRSLYGQVKRETRGAQLVPGELIQHVTQAVPAEEIMERLKNK